MGENILDQSMSDCWMDLVKIEKVRGREIGVVYALKALGR